MDSDQTHTPMFHQVEGLVIDEVSHLGHLKWVLEEFCKSFFEVPEVQLRSRPRLPHGFGPDPHADVPSGRRAGDRRGQPSRSPEMGARRVLQELLRGARGAAAFPAAPTAWIRTRPTRRCSIRSKGW